MTQPPLRFVHASDLHLERPLGGVVEAPEDLRSDFLEAPYLAAEQVFETALAEGADALLLAGDVVDLDLAGPRAVEFLTEQFHRLAASGVNVFWAGGRVDPPDAWPRCAPLSDNVHRFPVGRVQSFPLSRRGVEIAHIQGISRSPGQADDETGFHCDSSGLFTVGVAYGTSAAPGAEGDQVNYMALGGRHRRQTVDQSPGVAHFCGTPQGRRPEDAGARGCSVVSVDEAGHVKSKFVATDAVRWASELVEITAGVDEAALYNQLEARAAKLRAQHPDRALLITWRIKGNSELVNRLRPGGASDGLLHRLRKRFADTNPPTWNVDLICQEPLATPAEWLDEETIRGDLLRQFRDLQFDKSAPLDLAPFLPEETNDVPLVELAEVAAGQREQLLIAASKLAMELLDVEDND